MNWEKGHIFGGTMTVEAYLANIVLACLTIVILVAAGQLWSLLIFLYHQLRAAGVPSDGLFWQQQVLLR